MQLRSLQLKNFRSYSDARFDFSEGVNVISGANAKGKTTILEAIYLLISGHSFRTAHMQELIKHGEEAFFIEAYYLKHGIEQRLAIAYGQNLLKVIHNSSQTSTLVTLFGALSGVVMAPDDAALVKGSPQVRRRYLDLQIAQSDPLYIHYARRYKRALRQRNALLKARSSAAIEGWEEEMATAAAYISKERSGALAALSSAAATQYQKLTGEQQPLSMRYAPTLSGEDYLAQYQRMRKRELEVGYTLKGPHKDDFIVAIGDHPVRHFGSEGQQRSCIAAMRLSEWSRLKEKLSASPLMLVDDIAIGLDPNRCARIYEELSTLSQVFLTTTEEATTLPLDKQKIIQL